MKLDSVIKTAYESDGVKERLRCTLRKDTAYSPFESTAIFQRPVCRLPQSLHVSMWIRVLFDNSHSGGRTFNICCALSIFAKLFRFQFKRKWLALSYSDMEFEAFLRQKLFWCSSKQGGLGREWCYYQVRSRSSHTGRTQMDTCITLITIILQLSTPRRL